MKLPKKLLPREVSDVELAFPAHAMKLMPALADIPEEFKPQPFGPGTSPWLDLQRVWFCQGLSSRFSFVPTEVNGERLDGPTIMRHLSVIQGSFEPKHEHKEAAVAYLSSLWMEAVVYGPKDCEDEDLKALGEFSIEEWLEHFEAAAQETTA